MGKKTRRLNLGDLLILIAALSASIAGMRPLWLGHLAWTGVVATKQVGYDRLLVTALLSACITPLTLACLAIRLRRPRPPWHRVAIQPGTAAMLACVVIFAARTLELSASLIAPDVYRFVGIAEMGRSSPIRFNETNSLALIRTVDRGGVIGSIEAFGCHSTLVAGFASPCGPAVAAVWVVLALSGRWRPERSWIDRMGRFLGSAWILLSALAGLPV